MASIAHRIHQLASEDPGRPALFGRSGKAWKHLSRGAWWSSIRQAASGLLNAGLSREDTVLVWTSGTPECLVVWPAVNLAGAAVRFVHPAAPLSELEEAADGQGPSWVVVDDVERLEQVLASRERGSLSLEGIVTLDRIGVESSRVHDLESLIARGSDQTIDLDQHSTDPNRPTVANGSHAWHWDELWEESMRFVQQVEGRAVLLGCELVQGRAVVAAVAAVAAGSELWLGPDLEDLLEALPETCPEGLVMDEAGWRRIRGRLERAADELPGIRAGMARVARGLLADDGSRLIGQVLRPAHTQLGVHEATCWCVVPLSMGITTGLGRLGLKVQPLP